MPKTKPVDTMIISASPKEVRAALRCYRAKKRGEKTDRAKMALRLLDMIERFIASGGRFKKKYTKKKKKLES